MPKRKARRPHPPKPSPPPEGTVLIGLDVSSRAAGVALARRGERGLIVMEQIGDGRFDVRRDTMTVVQPEGGKA